MDEAFLLLAREEEHKAFRQVLGLQGAPAYMRRAQRVQEAYDQLLARCQYQREQWLSVVRVRLGMLHALAGCWQVLRPWLADDVQLDTLQILMTLLQPHLRSKIAATTSPQALRRALTALCDQVERFNRRWQTYLQQLDLGPVNTARDGYNRYYVLEKECVVRSPRIARQGFEPLPPLTIEDVSRLLPPLPVPQLRR